MLSKFDDYPIHQTPDPVAHRASSDKDVYERPYSVLKCRWESRHRASSDKDVYERYWFNGYSRAGDMYLGVGTALYPHLGIQDAGFLSSTKDASTPSMWRPARVQSRAIYGLARSIWRSLIRCDLAG